MLVIKIPNTKTNIQRTFTVSNNSEDGSNHMDIYRKYVALRPVGTNSRQLLVRFSKGVCYNQVVGVNTIAKIPKDVAEFLKLPDSALYTGHCFRRTSASLLANAGADLLALKRHGGWRSSTVAEGYVDDCISNKLSVGQQIFNGNKVNSTHDKITTFHPSTILDNPNRTTNSVCTTVSETRGPSEHGFNIQNSTLTNCTFIINNSKN